MSDEKSMRDKFAATAPITLEQVLAVFGDPDADMQGEHTRAAVYGLWAMMRYEYADAMLAERAGHSANRAEEQQAGPMDTAYSKSVSAAGDADGWIAWHGGKRPVMADVKVEVRLRNGSVHTIPAGFFCWAHEAKYGSASPGEIVAYRVVRNVWENREENDIG